MDAFEKPFWNYYQLVAWVYNGNRSLVRICDDDAPQRYHWEELVLPDGRKELIEVPSSSPNLIRHQIEADFNNGAAYPSLRDAQDNIREKLVSGEITAFGIANNQGDRQVIPTLAWTDLEYYEEYDRGHNVFGPKDIFRSGSTRWYNTIFKREEILKVWPDPLSQMAPLLSNEPACISSEFNIDTTDYNLCDAISVFSNADDIVELKSHYKESKSVGTIDFRAIDIKADNLEKENFYANLYNIRLAELYKNFLNHFSENRLEMRAFVTNHNKREVIKPTTIQGMMDSNTLNFKESKGKSGNAEITGIRIYKVGKSSTSGFSVWLTQYVANNTNKKPGKRHVLDQYKQENPQHTEAQYWTEKSIPFLKVWNAHVPVNWKKPGRLLNN